MSEIYRNLEEVTEKAIKTGEKVVAIQCPCCSKTFYALESEAVYQTIVRNEDDYALDLNKFSGKILGRKCPFCGFAGGYVNNSIKEQQVQQMQVEMEAEQMAQDLADKRKTPWSQICNQGPDFNTRGDQ